ncbi:MAG TPA: hypothetical protein VHD60_02540, partial [Candidatus Saccharimonadales bacterium]|nr:hypothetical protein [Candidatus Saccharimonadales bacterium]
MAERTVLAGTDGFRGEATNDPGPGLVNTETFEGLTYALVDHQLESGNSGPVVVGQDTRPSSAYLREAVIAGALKCGVEVWDMGIAPTPAIQLAAQRLGGSAVAVTASHNPYTDNGWKGMPGGEKPSKDVALSISDGYWGRLERGDGLPTTLRGTRVARPNLVSWYADAVVQDIEEAFGERPLADKLIVVDGARGAAQALTPTILERLGARVERFACDGKGFINEGCGAANLEGLEQFLGERPEITSHPDFLGALANDGDADRLMGIGVLNDNGNRRFVEINGNHIMHELAQGQPGIVGTEYTNTGMVSRLRDSGIGFEYCANGDVYVTQKLRELQNEGKPWTRGGEFSGHLIDLEWLSSGDGVRMAAWLAAYAATNGMNFAEIQQSLPLWPEHAAKIKFGAAREDIKEDKDVQEAIGLATAELDQDGRVVVRPSGTEPVVRVWGEARNRQRIIRIVEGLAGLVAAKALQSRVEL